jgi:hypothetical protein
LFDIHTWELACPHSLSFNCPVLAFQEDVLYSLRTAAALAFVGISLVDEVKICLQANLACAHLHDYQADYSVYSQMCIEDHFSWPNSKSEEAPAVLRIFPSSLPLKFHRLADGRFRGCHQRSYRVRSGLFGDLGGVGGFLCHSVGLA